MRSYGLTPENSPAEGWGMDIEEARSIKRSIVAATTASLHEDAAYVAGPFGMAVDEGPPVVREWEGIALGLSRRSTGDVRLALRATSEVVLTAGPVADLLDVRGEEVDIEITGEIVPFTLPYEGPVDPLQAGYSVGHVSITAGTLGAFVRPTTGDDVHILSNNHVLAAVNNAAAGDVIVAPGPLDGGLSARRVATLTAFEALVPGAANLIDGAIAQLDPTAAFTLSTPEGLTPRGALGNDEVDDGLAVTKVGRTTGVTRGRVTAVELDGVRVNYTGAGVFSFDNQIEIKTEDGTPFSRPGDSGSLIVTDDEDRLAVGLLFAGGAAGGHHTYANPIETVLDTLGIVLL